MYFIHKIRTIKLIREEKIYMQSFFYIINIYIYIYIVKYDIVTKDNVTLAMSRLQIQLHCACRAQGCCGLVQSSPKSNTVNYFPL